MQDGQLRRWSQMLSEMDEFNFLMVPIPLVKICVFLLLAEERRITTIEIIYEEALKGEDQICVNFLKRLDLKVIKKVSDFSQAEVDRMRKKGVMLIPRGVELIVGKTPEDLSKYQETTDKYERGLLFGYPSTAVESFIEEAQRIKSELKEGVKISEVNLNGLVRSPMEQSDVMMKRFEEPWFVWFASLFRMSRDEEKFTEEMKIVCRWHEVLKKYEII